MHKSGGVNPPARRVIEDCCMVIIIRKAIPEDAYDGTKKEINIDKPLIEMRYVRTLE